MKDIHVLLVLLFAQLTKVSPLPYHADSNGDCGEPNMYLLDGSNLCCSKCQPGQYLLKECTETTDSVCKQCESNQYMESWNYFQNCFSCVKCKPSKGLEYASNCSATSRTKCICKPGWFCTIEYEKPYCSGCQKYNSCKVGFGVSQQGTAETNTKCKPCPDGTFSDKLSFTDPCQPHTDCGGRAVVRKGNATSDTVCEPEASKSSTQLQTSTKESHTETALSTAKTTTRILPVTPAQALVESTQFVRPSFSDLTFYTSTKSTTVDTEPAFQTAATICGVMAVLFLITIITLCLCKSFCKKDAERLHQKVDANGNCESGNKITQDYKEQTQLISFAATSLEQQCLLEKGEDNSDYSQCSSNTESFTRTDGCRSHESTRPLQSTVALNHPSSVLSEPMPLISNTDPVISQSSILTQSSSQPTSPQIINPVTTSPHVNVNITFHIGNGTCGTPSVMSTDFTQAERKLPFGEEEESFSIPQQEDGKQSLMSVQESTSYCV